MSALEKWSNGNSALTPERRLMNEALAKLGRDAITATETRRGASRGGGRLVFILDATASREPGLEQARIAMAAMFEAVKAIGSIRVKLIYFRADECKAGRWETDPSTVSKAMQKLSCEAGGTQIARALRCVLKEGEVSGVVFIGDHFEEDDDEVVGLAASLGKKQTPIFVFHECSDNAANVQDDKRAFKRMTAASGGVYSELKADSVNELRELLSTVAAFGAAGSEGVQQMEPATTPQAQQLQKRLLLPGPGGGDGDLQQKR